MSLLELTAVGKRFGTLQALEGVDLSVEEGSFHGLIGPNGSGKSTLLKAIAGEHLPDAGRILFRGQNLTNAGPSERARAGLSRSIICSTPDAHSTKPNMPMARGSGAVSSGSSFRRSRLGAGSRAVC